MSGTARDIPVKFPKSTNVAASVALAVGDLDAVRVRVVADPGGPPHAARGRGVGDRTAPTASRSRHLPDPGNPATSQVVPYAVLRSLAAVVGRSGMIL